MLIVQVSPILKNYDMFCSLAGALVVHWQFGTINIELHSLQSASTPVTKKSHKRKEGGRDSSKMHWRMHDGFAHDSYSFTPYALNWQLLAY